MIVQDLRYKLYGTEEHAFPRLRLKCRPNLISLAGGMAGLPVTDAAARATPLPPPAWKAMLAEVGERGGERGRRGGRPGGGWERREKTCALPAAQGEGPGGEGATHTAHPLLSMVDPQAQQPGTEDEQKPVVLDVRNSYEWDAGHFQGAERPVEVRVLGDLSRLSSTSGSRRR